MPQDKYLDDEDPSTIVLKFAPGALPRGWCFSLNLMPMGLYEPETTLMHNHTDVCTSNCLCDPTGTHQCIEKTGTCQCKFPHHGKLCAACVKGHIKDPQTG